jgi:hydrogenase maturation protease
MSRTVVLGLGEAGRADDGVGPAVIWALRRLDVGDAQLVIWRGDATRLCDCWDRAGLVVVIDGGVAASTPGRIHRRSLFHPSAARTTAASVHGHLLRDAVNLSAAFDRLPTALLLYTIDGPSGAILSRSVRTSIAALAAEIAAELAARVRHGDGRSKGAVP